MYLYVLTQWCQKSIHQNVTQTHNYKENACPPHPLLLQLLGKKNNYVQSLLTSTPTYSHDDLNKASANKIKIKQLHCLGAFNFKLLFHAEEKTILRILSIQSSNKMFSECAQKKVKHSCFKKITKRSHLSKTKGKVKLLSESLLLKTHVLHESFLKSQRNATGKSWFFSCRHILQVESP